MKKIFVLAFIALTSMSMMAQETYENTKYVETDLNGSAKYVSMGGAMEALGADISTMSTNPAGIGLFRSSFISGTIGLVSLQDAQKFSHGDKTNVSLDQAGFVYTCPNNDYSSFFNLGFSYRKSRNFNEILNAAGALNNASQNKLTYQKFRREVFLYDTDLTFTQVDDLYMRNLLYNQEENAYFYFPATSYKYDRAQEGYIGEYDFNLSGNINDRVYVGVTFGLHDVNYEHYSEYSEAFQPNEDNIEGLALLDERKITGTGFDIKAGVIVRPVETSPFRIGAYVHTPTWYSLTSTNDTRLTDYKLYRNNGEKYEFKIYTPWKFGVSVGHTIGNYLALGATYEYADYSRINTRINNTDYKYYAIDRFYSTSHEDRNMMEHTKETLKGVSTAKVGVEYRPDPTIAVRFGYNYVSPMFDSNGSKAGHIASPGNYYESQTNYTNWKATNRITCGIGWTATSNLTLDLAYQYSVTKGDFYPFMNYYENDVDGPPSPEDNHCDATDVSFKRHQVLVTLGYRF